MNVTRIGEPMTRFNSTPGVITNLMFEAYCEAREGRGGGGGGGGYICISTFAPRNVSQRPRHARACRAFVRVRTEQGENGGGEENGYA